MTNGIPVKRGVTNFRPGSCMLIVFIIQLGLAVRLEKHELIEFRRLAAMVYKQNSKWRRAVELAKADGLFRDAMETTSQSGDVELADELLRYVDEFACWCLGSRNTSPSGPGRVNDDTHLTTLHFFRKFSIAAHGTAHIAAQELVRCGASCRTILYAADSLGELWL